MTETITRIQFAPNKVTIYSGAGVLAIWRGKPAAVLAAVIVDAVQGIAAKMAEESAQAGGDQEGGARADEQSDGGNTEQALEVQDDFPAAGV